MSCLTGWLYRPTKTVWARATFAAYDSEIRTAIRSGRRPVLVELRDIPADILPFVDVIDHHGSESGHLPTSLEQVLTRFGVTTLTREQSLIAANDKGYIEGMVAIEATPEEIARIRRADRESQGITTEQELVAESAVAAGSTLAPGLTLVKLPHDKTATVTDWLSSVAGGPGYSNLLIESPHEVSFFGDGRIIARPTASFGGYCGGNLPERGYWGSKEMPTRAQLKVRHLVVQCIAADFPGTSG